VGDVDLLRFRDRLKAAGWRVERQIPPRSLPDFLLKRYPAVPGPLRELQTTHSLCTNPDETAWFLTAGDFDGTSGSVFLWNELEEMSLADARDEAEQSRIRSFWNRHYPFLLSVKTTYAYFALDLAGEGEKAVVHGYDPFFERPIPAAPSLGTFLETFLAAVEGEGNDSHLGTLI
jgi:hypothetical protein